MSPNPSGGDINTILADNIQLWNLCKTKIENVITSSEKLELFFYKKTDVSPLFVVRNIKYEISNRKYSLSSFQVIEWTRFVTDRQADRQMDRRMLGEKQYVSRP